MKQLTVFSHFAETDIQVRQMSCCRDRGVNVCIILQRREDEAFLCRCYTKAHKVSK
jgi:hypothetical protein